MLVRHSQEDPGTRVMKHLHADKDSWHNIYTIPSQRSSELLPFSNFKLVKWFFKCKIVVHLKVVIFLHGKSMLKRPQSAPSSLEGQVYARTQSRPHTPHQFPNSGKLLLSSTITYFFFSLYIFWNCMYFCVFFCTSAASLGPSPRYYAILQCRWQPT